MFLKTGRECHQGFERIVGVRMCVSVQGHVINPVAGLFQYQLRPLDPLGFPVEELRSQREVFPAACRRSRQFYRRVYAFHHLAEFGSCPGIFLRGLVADLTGAVDFVADTPVFHVVRFFKTMCTAQFGRRRVARAVAIFHPVGGFPHVAVSAIGIQIRFRS